MKKGQITLFIIIGLVLLFGTGLFMYYIGLNIPKSEQTIDDASSVNTFIESCMNKVSDDAFNLIGRQGGVIYLSQGDSSSKILLDESLMTIHENYNIDEDGYKVKNLIEKETIDSIGYNSEPPKYPWEFFPYKDNKFILVEKKYTGLFGRTKLPPLTKTTTGFVSMQEYFEEYVKNQLPKCVDQYNDFPEYELVFDEAKLDTTFLISESDTTILINYPIGIKRKLTGQTYSKGNFVIKKNIRLRDIHELADRIITKDSEGIKYDIELESTPDSGIIRNEVPVPPSTENYGTFITIRDMKSTLNGLPYEFTFGRENRNPALEYIMNVDNLPVFPISGLLNDKDSKEAPRGCKYDKVTSTVTCEFGWHTRKISCPCIPPPKEGPCCCCTDILEFHSNSFVINDDMFKNQKFSFDPDEDTLNYDYGFTAPCTTFPCNVPELAGNPGKINFDILVRVNDPTKRDWQVVHFIINWKNCGTEGACPCKDSGSTPTC